MVKKNCIIGNEEGSAIVYAILILAVLSILGISSTNISNVELKIVSNEKIHKQNFYQAESAALEAAQILEAESNKEEMQPSTTTKTWLKDATFDLQDSGIMIVNADSATVDAVNAQMAANALGVAGGGSLDMSKTSNMYAFEVYGISRRNDGQVFIMIGYKKRY